MKIPMQWINAYAPINVDAETYQNKMIMIGNGVEGYEAVGGEVERPVLEPPDRQVGAGGDPIAHPGDPRGELGGDQGDRGDHRGEDPDDDDDGCHHPRHPVRNPIDEGPEHGGQQHRDRHRADDQRQPADALPDEPCAGGDEQQAHRPGRGQTDRVRQVVTRDANGGLCGHEEQLRRGAQAMSPIRRASHGSSRRRPSDHTA